MSASETKRTSPYQGLIPFGEADAPFFFGREKETRLIIANLFACPLTLLYGASGVGKSSVLRAGVAHQLRERNDLLTVVFNAWQSNPVNNLKQAIADWANLVDHASWRKVVQHLPQDHSASLTEFLTICSTHLNRRLMIVLDQFEEYFLYHPQDDEFAAEFPQAITQLDAPVSFLISIREDFFSKLDRFEGRIPVLYDNYLRIEHLDRNAARIAIEKPIAHYNREAANGRQFSIEYELVESILKQVETGRVILGEAGRGVVEAAKASEKTRTRIETPFLQLVMTRVWDEELNAGSQRLRQQTLDRLGGAENIVRTHLDAVITKLTPDEQEIAAGVFHYLVTPSGTKITYNASDLAVSAELEHKQVERVLDKLSHGDVRILRTVEPSPDRPSTPRYEIFHDVLAPAILTWRTAYVQAQERTEAERVAQQQRQAAEAQARIEEKAKSAGRLRWLSAALAVMTLLALATAAYALTLKRKADASAGRAQKEADIANYSTMVAEKQRGLAEEQRKEAAHQAELAAEQRKRADEQAELAQTRAADAEKARGEAEGAQKIAEAERQRANQQAAINKSRELAAAARNYLSSDPELSVLLALRGVSELTAEGLSARERQGIKAIDKKEVIDSLHEAVQSSRLRKTFADMSGRVGHVVYPLKGRIITGTSEGGLRLWDAESGQLVRKLPGGLYTSMTLSEDGTRMAITNGDSVEVLDVNSGENVRTLPDNKARIRHMTFSKDDSTLAIARDRELRLWNMATGESFELPYGEYNSFSHSVELLTFNNDGKTLVVGGCTHSIRGRCTTLETKAWDLNTRREARPPVSLRFGDSIELHRRFSPNGDRLFAAVHGTGQIWDPASDKPLFDLSQEPIIESVFTQDGKQLAILKKSGEIDIWDSYKTERVQTVKTGINEAKGLAFSPDGKRIAAFKKQIVKMWDVDSGDELLTLSGHKENINSFAFSPDGLFIATASDDSTARIWDISPSRELLTLSASGMFVGVLFSPDGERLAGATSESAKMWDAHSGAEVFNLGHDSKVTITGFAYSQDGKRLATSSSDGSVKIWDAGSGLNILTIAGRDKENTAGNIETRVTFGPDGKLFATAGDDLRVRDAATGREVRTLSGPGSEVRSVAFSPNGDYLVSAGSYGVATVWDLKTGREVAALDPRHPDVAMTKDIGISQVAFSHDGKRLVIAGDLYVSMYDVPTWRLLNYLSGHKALLNDVTFSADDRFVATASDDGTAKMWDAMSGFELLSLTGHTSSVTSVAFSRDGSRLVTSGYDGTVRVYTLDLPTLIALAEKRVTRRELTADERRRYLHELPKPK